MVERATVFERVQIGLEAPGSPGTLVAANKQLVALGIAPTPAGEINAFRPQGTKFNTLTAKGREWTEADLTGQPTYTEIIYPLASVLTAPVTTTPAGGTTSKEHTFTPVAGGPDAPSTFTVEAGSSVRASRFTYGLIREFTMSFSRETLELGGTMIGRALVDGTVMTPAPTVVELLPILPEQLSIYLDAPGTPDPGANLGTTKLLRWLSGELTISDRYEMVWPIDAAQASFVAHVETAPTVELTLMLAADAAGMALLADLRASARKFLRIEAVGPIIETTINNRFRLDMCVEHTEMPPFSDENGVYAIEFTLSAVYDGTWGKAIEVAVTNNLATL